MHEEVLEKGLHLVLQIWFLQKWDVQKVMLCAFVSLLLRKQTNHCCLYGCILSKCLYPLKKRWQILLLSTSLYQAETQTWTVIRTGSTFEVAQEADGYKVVRMKYHKKVRCVETGKLKQTGAALLEQHSKAMDCKQKGSLSPKCYGKD